MEHNDTKVVTNTKQEQLQEFNEKYNLNNINLNWLNFDKKITNAIEIPGKPTKLIIDIWKRFAKNKFNLIALSLFLAVIIFIFVGYFTTPYSATDTILPSDSARASYYAWMPSNAFGDSVRYFWINSSELSGYQNVISATPGADLNSLQVLDQDPANNLVYISLNLSTLYDFPAPVIIGADDLGRDIWSRTLTGAGFSFLLAFCITAFELVIGTAIGAYVGFHAGKTLDTVVMRIIGGIGNIPSILILLILFQIISPSFLSLFITTSIIGWIVPVYPTRQYMILIKDREFIKSAELTGSSKLRAIFTHALPNIAGRLAGRAVSLFSANLTFEISLVIVLGISRFEGLTTLGVVFEEARSFFVTQPQYVVLSLVIILATTLSLALISIGLRDALDPKIIDS